MVVLQLTCIHHDREIAGKDGEGDTRFWRENEVEPERNDYTLLVKDVKNRKQFSITSPAAPARNEEWNALNHPLS